MKFLIATAAAALLGLSACNAPQEEGDDEEDRTEQRERDGEDD